MVLRNEVKKIKLTLLYLVHNASTTYLIKRPVSIYSALLLRLDVSCIKRCCFADPRVRRHFNLTFCGRQPVWPLTLPKIFLFAILRDHPLGTLVMHFGFGVFDVFFDLIIFILFACLNAQTADLWLAGLQGLCWSWINSHGCTMLLCKKWNQETF